MSLDHRLLLEAHKLGLSPAEMTDAQFRAAALAAMTAREKVAAAASVAGAYARVTIAGQEVPGYVEEARRGKCEPNTCGSFIRLADGSPACLDCGCSGSGPVGLTLKWKDKKSKCPKKPPLWSEYTDGVKHP